VNIHKKLACIQASVFNVYGTERVNVSTGTGNLFDIYYVHVIQGGSVFFFIIYTKLTWYNLYILIRPVSSATQNFKTHMQWGR